jgi:ABC-type uncharacterized transport system fused permease/ATPase subunit
VTVKGTDNPDGVQQRRYSMGNPRNSIRCNIKKKRGFTVVLSFVLIPPYFFFFFFFQFLLTQTQKTTLHSGTFIRTIANFNAFQIA